MTKHQEPAALKALYNALTVARAVIQKTRLRAREESCVTSIPYRELGDALDKINQALAKAKRVARSP